LNIKSSTRKSGRGRGQIVLEKSLNTCPRFVAAKLAYTKHLRRVAFNIAQNAGLTESSRTVVKDIVDLMMWFSIDSAYAEIRKLAQNVVHSVVKVHAYMMPGVYPRVLDALRQGETAAPDRMKGALFMVNRSQFASFVLRSWKGFGAFVEMMMKGYYEDKPSVQKRIRKLVPEFMRKWNDVGRGGDVLGGGVVGYVEAVVGEGGLEGMDEYAVMKTRVKRTEVVERAAYDELMSFLIGHLATPNLHWFYTATSIGLLEIIINREIGVSAKLMKAVMETCLLSDIRAGMYIG
jgi:hypothetical protein